MRTHLIDMLDTLELQRYLGIRSCGDLFQDHSELLHTTSLLRFPVFAAGDNYNGTQDGMHGAERCLWGFPHPSGANGHRHKQFASHQESMRNKIRVLAGE